MSDFHKLDPDHFDLAVAEAHGAVVGTMYGNGYEEEMPRLTPMLKAAYENAFTVAYNRGYEAAVAQWGTPPATADVELLLWAADELDAQAQAHGESVTDYTDHLRCFTTQPERVSIVPRSASRPPAEDDHPERICQRCGRSNVPTWTAPSPLWNQVMRGGDINGKERFDGIVCPVCFAVLAEEAGIAQRWRFYAEKVHVELATVTPSGRVWNPQTWLWDDPSRPPAAEVEDIDDAIGRWHDGDGEGQALHEYLGMTWDEYKRWAETSQLPKGSRWRDSGGAASVATADKEEPDMIRPDDTYTGHTRLCDDDGVVRQGAMHHGADYPCTGHAHIGGEHIRCTSPAHAGPDYNALKITTLPAQYVPAGANMTYPTCPTCCTHDHAADGEQP